MNTPDPSLHFERRPSRRLPALAAVVVAGAALVASACVPETPPATTTTTTTTAPASTTEVALDAAAAWLLAEFDGQPLMASEYDPAAADLGNGVVAVADLAALDIDEAGEAARMDALEAEFESYVDPGTGDVPGSLARVILAVVATGADPHDFGGTDLVARLEATIQPDGHFGTQFSAYDGVFRQGLALAALSVVEPRPASITPAVGTDIAELPVVAWLSDQQCTDGSWMSFRADTSAACIEDPASWTFKDSNASAYAALGLAAIGATAPVDPVSWFTAVRGNDGGWGSSPAEPAQISDADSTGLVIAALEALGSTPDAAAYDALLALQLGESDPIEDRGAFFWKAPDRSANRFATLDAMTALFDGTWPEALVG